MSINILGPADLRAEMARRNISRKEVAERLGLSYSYVRKILAGLRDAEARRAEIGEFLESTKPKEMRGIA